MTLYTKQGTRYKPTTLSEQGAWGWKDLMVIAAFRYCLGRMTYISGVCADWLADKWPELPPHSKALISARNWTALLRKTTKTAPLAPASRRWAGTATEESGKRCAHCGRASNHLHSRANRRPQSLPPA